MQQSSLIKAVGILLFGIAAFDVMSVFVRFLGDTFPILQISVFRNIFGMVPALILLAAGPGFVALKKLNNSFLLKIVLIRSAAVLLAQLSFYTALTKIEFATAATLSYTSPFFITLLSIPLLGHHIGFVRFLAIIFGFAGVVAIFRPFNDDFTIWMTLPILAGFGYGLSSVLVKRIPDEIDSSAIQITQQFTTFLMGVCLLFTTGEFVPIVSLDHLMYFCLMGVCGGIGLLCLIIAYRLADPSSLSIFEYFGIPISFIFGWLAFREAPISTLFPGALLIIGAGVLIFLREKRSSNQKPKQAPIILR